MRLWNTLPKIYIFSDSNLLLMSMHNHNTGKKIVLKSDTDTDTAYPVQFVGI